MSAAMCTAAIFFLCLFGSIRFDSVRWFELFVKLEDVVQALNVGESEASEEIPPLGALPISKEVWRFERTSNGKRMNQDESC